jgi:hypothetical protein
MLHMGLLPDSDGRRQKAVPHSPEYIALKIPTIKRPPVLETILNFFIVVVANLFHFFCSNLY